MKMTKGKSIKMIVLASFIGIFLTGCAGTNFVRVPDESIKLNQTTVDQVIAMLGTPYREGTVTKNDQQIKTMAYAYASTGGEAAVKDVTAARSQGFYFFNKKLVGYEFTSSWKEDSTNFDSDMVKQIKKGTSTQQDVINILGHPSGKYVYPMIPNKNENAIIFLYSQTKGSAFNLKFYQKKLVVTFDQNGIVTNVDFTESGQK